jgi:hypothetical protein
MFKNVAGQKIGLFEFNYTTGAPVTGDAANITVYVSKDFGTATALGNTTVNELSSTHAAGWYWALLAQAETNANDLLYTGVSTTANTSIVGQQLFTTPPNFNALGIDAGGNISEVTLAVTVTTVGNVSGTVGNVTGTPSVNVIDWNGTTLPASVTAGLPDVNVKNIGGSAAVGTAGYVSPDWGNVSAKTATVNLTNTTVGNVSGTVGNVTGNPTVTVTIAGMTAISDNLLNRDMSAGTDSGNQTFRTPRQAFQALRNKMDASSGTTVSVYSEDDTTLSWTQPLTGNASAVPIVKVGT